MKKLILIAALLVIFQHREDIKYFFIPAADYSAMLEEEVILYATSWCKYCEKARELMDRHKIPYVEYDIEKSKEGSSQYQKLGVQGVPVLLINGQVVVGYSESKILGLVTN